jgi:UDP-2-acetamido-2,6-beta-L-arabino-hexul-4-ose reductase
MSLTTRNKVYEDKRGSFQELVHANEIRFGQLGLLKIKEGCRRGGHYHKRKEEWFACIHGICRMELANIKTGVRNTIIMGGLNNEFIYVAPFESHTVVNFSDSECELLVISSETYNDKDSDTIKFEVDETA